MHFIVYKALNTLNIMGLKGSFHKIALILVAIGLHLHVWCICTSGRYTSGDRFPWLEETEGDIVTAFLILSLFIYLSTFTSALSLNFGRDTSFCWKLSTAIGCFAGGKFTSDPRDINKSMNIPLHILFMEKV